MEVYVSGEIPHPSESIGRLLSTESIVYAISGHHQHPSQVRCNKVFNVWTAAIQFASDIAGFILTLVQALCGSDRLQIAAARINNQPSEFVEYFDGRSFSHDFMTARSCGRKPLMKNKKRGISDFSLGRVRNVNVIGDRNEELIQTVYPHFG